MSVGASVEEIAQDLAREESKGSPKVRDRLIALLGIDNLRLSAKAADVQHHYERIFTAARITTDLRPVFHPDSTALVGAMIIHNLSITYYRRGRYCEAFFSMDSDDIATLRKVLDRADLKSASLDELVRRSGTEYFKNNEERSKT